MAEERYAEKVPEITSIWGEINIFRRWLDIEIAILEAQEELNLIPKGTVIKIKTAGIYIDVNDIKEKEKETNHDVVAFVKSIEKPLDKETKPYLHRNVTSYDDVDTALCITMYGSLALIIRGLLEVMDVLKKEASRFKYTAQIGRTHGMHAEPITFGVKLLNWYAELERHLERLSQMQEKIRIGKISGAVGMYNLPPEVEKLALQKLGLKPDKITNQIIGRDRHADYVYALTLLACSLEKFATEIRNLQRPEIAEVQEGFKKGQKGSSIMPFKKNPIACENICSLARLMRGFLQTAMENTQTWHERDLANSANERIILKDASIYCCFMLKRFKDIISNWVINEKRMLDNIYLSGGVIFSSKIVSKLTEKGMAYQEAYDLTQEIGFKILENNHRWDNSNYFEAALCRSEKIRAYLSEKEINECFDLNKQFLSHVGKIFERFEM